MSAPPDRADPLADRGALRPAVTLALLFGVVYLLFQGVTPSLQDGELALLVGFVLLAASVAGTLASAGGLPKITGFVVVGIVAGPSVLGLIPSSAVGDLHLIDRFALALIALLAGGELRAEHIRPQLRTIAVATAVVTGVVWAGVAGTVLAVRPMVPFLAELSWTAALGVALLVGVWAANSSPDLTVAVIEEEQAEGELAEVILGVTIVKDVVVIVLFTLTLALVTPLLDPGQSFSADALVALASEVGGALVLGAGLGWVFSQYLGDEESERRSPLATFLFAYVLVVLAAELHVKLLLTGVTAGFVVENLSPAGDRMIQGVRKVAVVVFAFFFAIAGASLELGALADFGLAAGILFVVRAVLTRQGTIWGTRLAGASDVVREYTWQGLISQGGVSLGLILVLQESFPELGSQVVALAMAIIVGNILGGPVLLGRALSAGRQEEESAAAEGSGPG